MLPLKEASFKWLFSFNIEAIFWASKHLRKFGPRSTVQKKSQSPAQKNRSWKEALFPTPSLYLSLSELRYDKRVRQVGSKGLPGGPVVPAGYENPSKAEMDLLKGPWSIPGWELRSHVPLQPKKNKT